MAYELGVRAAFEKEAGVLSALLAPAKGVGKLLQGALGGTGRGILKRVGTDSRVGKAMHVAAGKSYRGMDPLVRKATRAGNIPREMVGFGAFGGGIGALMDPEDRMRGALHGFASGAAGGLGWRAGSNLARAGQTSLMGTAMGPRGASKLLHTARRKILDKKIPGAANQQFWKRFKPGMGMTSSKTYKTLGARAALGVVPTAGAFAGAHALASPIDSVLPHATTAAPQGQPAGQMPYYQPQQQQQQQRQQQKQPAYHDLYQQGYY